MWKYYRFAPSVFLQGIWRALQTERLLDNPRSCVEMTEVFEKVSATVL